MKAMTELDVLKGLQSSICGLDLDHPHAIEMAMALGAQMEASAGRIISARCPVTQAWSAICSEPVDDLLNELEDIPMDELDRAHPVVYAPFEEAVANDANVHPTFKSIMANVFQDQLRGTR